MPKEKGNQTSLTISMPVAAKQALFAQAERERRNPTQVIQMALTLYYQAYERGEVT